MAEEQNVANKVQFGVSNLHYFEVTDTGEQLKFGEAYRLPGATELELDPEGDLVKFYADNIVYYTSNNNQGYSGKLSIAMTTEDFEALAFGTEKDENGIVTENINNKGKNLALAFEFDGDKKATRHILYNVTFSRPKISSETKSEKSEPKAIELEFTLMPDPYTGKVKSKTTSTTSENVYNNWYTAVGGITTGDDKPAEKKANKLNKTK